MAAWAHKRSKYNHNEVFFLSFCASIGKTRGLYCTKNRKTYPFQHVGIGVGAVPIKVKGLGRGLDTKAFGRVDVDIEPRAVGTLQPLGPQLCFLGA